MDWTSSIASVMAGCLCLYLFAALLKPEWFS